MVQPSLANTLDQHTGITQSVVHSGSKHWVKNTVGPNTKFLVIFFTMKKCYVMWEKKPGVESHAEKRKRIAIANLSSVRKQYT